MMPIQFQDGMNQQQSMGVANNNLSMPPSHMTLQQLQRRAAEEDISINHIVDKQLKKVMLPQVPDKSGPPTISLALLIDFAIQHTLHEITILSELLPKKKESDRKINVVHFAHFTRQIFVKLLAIVKWIRISKKFEPLTAIRYFLDQQAQLFVDTADRLVNIARDELRFARLPAFQVAPAVDVLTLGSYPRLPQNIKDCFIYKPVLSHAERALTLQRLNQVVEYHLTLASLTISPRFDSVVVRNGMAILKVSSEFEICITMLGEEEPPRWCLLNIRILVENNEVGCGEKLVHPLQVNLIHQVVQEKLSTSPRPLYDTYLVLHSFCQSLQLDVLYCQVMQMSAISQHYVRVEEYDRNRSLLTLSYWSNRSNKRRISSHYRITIFADSKNAHSALKTLHLPASSHLPCLKDTENPSISRLVGETIILRCRERLCEIKKILEMIEPFVEVRRTGNTFLTLTYPLITSGKRDKDENLEISIYYFSGAVICQIRALGQRNEITELEELLTNGASIELIIRSINRLRILIMIERFNKAICGLQVRDVQNQLVTEAEVLPILKKLKSIPADRRILQFNREDQYYLIVGFTPDSNGAVTLEFYLYNSKGGKCNIMALDPQEVAMSAPVPTVTLEKSEFSPDLACQRAKIRWMGSHRQLQAAVVAIDDRLMFLRISEELDKRNIKYEPIAIEPLVGGYVLRLTDVFSAFDSNCRSFFENLACCNLRLDLRQNLYWPMECTMINNPLIADFNCSRVAIGMSPSKRKSFTWIQSISSNVLPHGPSTISEVVSHNVIERLSIYSHVYEPVKRFSYVYESKLKEYCNIQAFTYHKLVLAYGPKRQYFMVMSWRPKNPVIPRSKAHYSVSFGQCENLRTMGQNYRRRGWNPHIVMASVLSEKFNKNADLVGFVYYLVNTCQSLNVIYHCSRLKLQLMNPPPQAPPTNSEFFPVEIQCHLTVLSETLVRLVCGVNHVEFFLLSDNRVSIRECPITVAQLRPPGPPVNPAALERYLKELLGSASA